jgi:hypothetical protein
MSAIYVFMSAVFILRRGEQDILLFLLTPYPSHNLQFILAIQN